MPSVVSLSQTQIFVATVAVLKSFGLQSVVDGQTVEIIRGQVNRVPEPAGQDFVVLWPIARDRIAMNIDTTEDNQFIGSITGNVLTVTAIDNGQIAPGQNVYAIAVTLNCYVIRQLTGTTGGLGTYALSPVADLTLRVLYSGTISAMQETEITVQADVHGPASADNIARISTLFRDQFAVDQFGLSGFLLTPLYASEPRQIPFDNGEQQVEERWVIDLCMQADIAIVTTMQFAERLQSTSKPVEALL